MQYWQQADRIRRQSMSRAASAVQMAESAKSAVESGKQNSGIKKMSLFLRKASEEST